ncbi:MAG: thioredoxin family protein [Deltaproteobacteria bacterium]|nr:thioredoxin family protein [Deltaproteobacteria bacterium]
MKRNFLIFLLFSVIFGTWSHGYAQEDRRDPFKVDFQDQVVRLHPGEAFAFKLNFKVPDKYWLYDDKTSLLFDKTDGLVVVQSERPPPEPHQDPFLKKTTQVYFHDFEQKVTLMVPKDAKPGRRTLEATLRYQGCSDDFCYRPMRRTVLLPVEVVPEGASLVPAEPPAAASSIEAKETEKAKPTLFELIHESNPERLLDQGKAFLLGLALFGGILTSFTPCVLPIIPLTLAFIGVKHRRRGNFLRALMLVLGMVTMYSVLGFLAASAGLKLGFLFQSRWFILFTALFFLVFALGLFEVIPFHLPPAFHNRLVRMGGEGPWGAFLAGLTIGLIASPCVGPLIGPLLLIAAREQDRFYGFLLLLNYGLGMGLIFVVLGTAYGELARKVKAGRWTMILKRGMAVLMLAPALYYGYVFTKPLMAKPQGGLWTYSFEKGLSAAKESRKPMIVDFYADWCPPCQELDKLTFSAPEVQALSESFVMVKVDCTTDDPQCRKATDRYEVVGWPTVLFLDSEGKPIEDVKLVGGFADKERMLSLMKEALKKTSSHPL